MGQITVEKNVGGIEGLCVITPAVYILGHEILKSRDTGFSKAVLGHSILSSRGLGYHTLPIIHTLLHK